ncbi:MAG: GntR family transcriptional regulator [Armatimonadota bacterium]
MIIMSISTMNMMPGRMDSAKTPLYRRLYNEMRDRINSKVYPPGTALPSESKMREEFGVSLITIRRAIHELALDGMVYIRHGIGSFVREPSRSDIVVGMSSFTSDVAEGRLRIVRTLMADELVPAPTAVADRLGVQVGSMVRRLVRLDCEGGAPLSVDEAFIPPALASMITPEMAASPLFMHLWQEGAGVSLVQTQYDIYVQPSGESDQELLQIGPDMPLLITDELIRDSNGRAAAWIETRYRSDRSRLSATVMLVHKETDKGIIGE